MSKNQIAKGYVAPGFEKVKTVFEENFKKRKELGASCCVYHKGKKVVDLWGGIRDVKTGEAWEEDTLSIFFSTTKGVSSMAVAHAHSRGLFDYDDKVVKHWPEFATGGKVLGLKQETLDALEQTAAAPTDGRMDQVLRLETAFSLDYLKPFPQFQFGTSDRAYGTPGAGGSFGFADPDAQVGFAYVMNKCGFYVWNDPREAVLRNATYECIKTTST